MIRKGFYIFMPECPGKGWELIAGKGNENLWENKLWFKADQEAVETSPPPTPGPQGRGDDAQDLKE